MPGRRQRRACASLLLGRRGGSTIVASLPVDATVEAGAGYGERQCAVRFLSDCRHVIVFSACGCRARQGAAVAE